MNIKPIETFKGTHRFLSNFWPCDITYEGIDYNSVEHAYQAAKTLDWESKLKISKMEKPGQAKRAGRKLVIRDDWNEIKVEVMHELNCLKYKPDSELAKMLLSTGRAKLIEGNSWGDTFWGMCKGVGENYMGRILMDIRSVLIIKKDKDEFTDLVNI